MKTINYQWQTARAECNDQQADTWEVRAQDDNGKWWTVSDSSEMSQPEAQIQAESMRQNQYL